jgi:hypothetical protein
MSDFSRSTRSRCPKCKLVFSRDDGVPCDCFDEVIILDAQPCVKCDKPANSFRDEESEVEFDISGLCQDCQDEVFDESNYED